MRTAERLHRSEKARRILDAIAGAGRALSPPEILERVPGNWNDAKQLLDAALLAGLVTRTSFGKRARYAIVPKTYGEWLAEVSGTENGTENGTDFAPSSLPSLRLTTSEAKTAAARTSFPDERRTELTAVALLRKLLALAAAPETGSEVRAHPDVRSPAPPLPPLTSELGQLREKIVKREGKRNPGALRETVHRRLASDPEYVKAKTLEYAEHERARTVAASPQPSGEEAAARAARERIGVARAKLAAVEPGALADYERTSIDLAREELGQDAKELRVRMRAVEIANEFVLEHVAKLVG